MAEREPNIDGVPEAAANGAGSMVQALVQEGVENKRKRKRRRWLVVLVIALIVFVASLAALGVIAYSYFQGQQKYGDIATTADIDTANLAQDRPLENVKVDWDALLAANADTVGWVYMPDSPINYPVVQGADNDHYLYYDFDGDAGWLAEYGAIFLDFRNNKGFIDPINFIYGHHMNDGSMFAVISQLEEKEGFDAHRIVYLLTPQGNYRLRSFAIVHCAADDPIVQTTFMRKKDMTSYVQDKIDRSLVKADDIPDAKDIGQVFAFATCDSYSAGRDVLFTYVEDTTAKGLEGNVGIHGNDTDTWLVDDLEVKE